LIYQLNSRQAGKKAKAYYPGYNHYDKETKNFIERHSCKNG